MKNGIAQPIKPGTRFGRLVVVGPGAMLRFGGCTKSTSICRCDCGVTKAILNHSLKRKRCPTASCGCLQKELVRTRMETHGKTKSRAYQTWKTMIQRCTNPSRQRYSIYGGRGITVCERWTKFENFYEDMGERPIGFQIERKNTNGNYEPGNCCWASRCVNMRNTRRARILSVRGKRLPLAEIAEISGIPYGTIYHRITDLGWSAERAATTPTPRQRRVAKAGIDSSNRK